MLAHSAQAADRRVGIYETTGRPFAPHWPVQLAARLRGDALDRALIAGADPVGSPLLAARATALMDRPMRRRVAAHLERLARSDREARSRTRVLPFRRAVRANAQELLALAALLRSSTPVYARGVAMLRRLVTDGTGAAYTDRDGRALAEQLRRARGASCG